MKRRIFSILAVLVLVLSFSLMTAVPVAAASEVWVNDDWTNQEDVTAFDPSLTWDTDAFDTIQEGVSAVDASGTVHVLDGSYTEGVTVATVGITIQGESLAAIVDGGFRLSANTITIDGLTIENGWATGADATYDPAAIGALNTDGHTIINNKIIGAANIAVSKTGILLKGSVNVLIDDNEVYDWGRGIAFISSSNSVTISNNDIHDNFQEGIGPGDSNDSVITLNDIYGNNINNSNESGGIAVYRGSGHVINFNNIYDNLSAGVRSHTITNLDATLNWWGDASGPLTTGNPGGLGNNVILDVGSIIASYSPWLGAVVGTSPMTFIVDDVDTVPATGYIRTAIAAAAAGDTISVADGTYNAETFPITVDVANLTIESVSGAASTTIDSSANGRVIAISAAGVTIGGTGKGFAITGTGAVADGLIYIGASANDATITANQFTGDYYLMVLGPTVSGVTVADNTFLAIDTPGNDVLGIYVNNDVTGSTFDGNSFPLGVAQETQHVNSGIYMATGTTADQTITISNNTFEGMGLGGGCAAIELDGVGGITIEGNTITGGSDGIWFEGTNPLTGDVTIRYNTITGNTWGISVLSGVGTSASFITANYNDLSGSITKGIDNETTTSVDARYNWWGAATGPDHAKNPYDALDSAMVAVSDYADYLPWMIHTSLASGWNVYSTPIASGTSTDTIDEALNLFGSGTESSNLVIAYYYDSSAATPAFAEVTSLTPLQAVYLNMSAASTIDVIFSTSYTAPPSQTVYAGWNLVGPAELYDRLVDASVASALYGTGEANLWGYSQVISPPLHQTYWTYLRDGTGTEKDFIPTNGYWVYMVNQGTLAGFTSTPITLLP